MTESLSSILTELSLSLPGATVDRLNQYVALLQQWNRVYNLTAIRDPQEILSKHVADSLSIAPYVKGTRALDVGTGAGLPGMILAIIHPEQHWVLLDSNGKKTRFLIQVKGELRLTNVEVVQARIETHRPLCMYDAITTRAWSQLDDIIKHTWHLLAPGGCCYAMKGQYPSAELAAITQTYAVHRLQVPGLLEQQRHLVCVQKSYG